MMKALGYYSSASKEFEENELEEIIETSAHNNKVLDVTGMLMYADGCFFQIIEGPACELDTLYEKIKHDHRHKGIITVIDEEVENRSFPDWSMGGLRLDPDILDQKEVFELTRMALADKLPDTAPQKVKIFMKSFYNASVRDIEV